MTDMTLVAGYCPMGCGQTLFLGEGGHVTCCWAECPRPSAVDEILDDQETEHVVELEPHTFNLLHPLRERLDGDLLTCALGSYLHGLSGPPRAPGRYRARYELALRRSLTWRPKPKPPWWWRALALLVLQLVVCVWCLQALFDGESAGESVIDTSLLVVNAGGAVLSWRQLRSDVERRGAPEDTEVALVMLAAMAVVVGTAIWLALGALIGAVA